MGITISNSKRQMSDAKRQRRDRKNSSADAKSESKRLPSGSGSRRPWPRRGIATARRSLEGRAASSSTRSGGWLLTSEDVGSFRVGFGDGLWYSSLLQVL